MPGSNSSGQHVPVLLSASLELLNIRSGKVYIDATAGGGGHLAAILQRVEAINGVTMRSDSTVNGARVIGIDRDDIAIDNLQRRLGEKIALVHSNYADLKESLSGLGIEQVTGGIIADLGVSSMQLDYGERGFSFLREGPLDMRMDPTQSMTAAGLINTLSERELSDIIFQYGEERHSRQIARAIVHARPLHTTTELANVVSRCIKRGAAICGTSPKRTAGRGNRPLVDVHPATRTFQAIRIAVNNELGSLQKFLEDALAMLSPGARLVVITFHSLEDRIVKQILRREASECLCPPRQPVCTCHHKPELLIITRKPIIAESEEILANIRSRSAKLRAGEKI